MEIINKIKSQLNEKTYNELELWLLNNTSFDSQQKEEFVQILQKIIDSSNGACACGYS
jgi:hypothetical protein